jgi:PLP dependent protein
MSASIADRLHAVLEAVAAAAREGGRAPEEITVIGVSKRQPIEKLFEAYDAGLRDFGENTVQELAAKSAAMAWTGREPRWHLIGHLQRNKINATLQTGATIHTIDSLELAQAVSQRAAQSVDVLLQVNVGREPQKKGCDPDLAVTLAPQIAMLPSLRLRGLMAIPPAGDDPTVHFRRLAALRDAIVVRQECAQARDLSMGMSQDFVQAVRCQATMVRVGTLIFGDRD